jgi:hypothetical protein
MNEEKALDEFDWYRSSIRLQFKGLSKQRAQRTTFFTCWIVDDYFAQPTGDLELGSSFSLSTMAAFRPPFSRP